MAEKKNPNYEDSAVNLCNPPEVKECLMAQRARIQLLANLEAEAQAYIPEEVKLTIAKLRDEIAAEDKSIRGYIDTFGSYQDPEKGEYAVKQTRESI